LIILGLNAFHGDSAAALIRDGRLVAAAEEERFRRTKHWAGFPSEAIVYCLREAGLDLQDVDHIALNQNSRANFWRKVAYMARARPDFGQEFRGSVHNVEHHLCHLFSAYYVSPFADAAVVSVDGFGDFSSAAWGAGLQGKINVSGRVHFPHSLGIFYQALTQYLGFPHYGDEYKVMGLAPYGRPNGVDEMRKLVSLRPGGGFELNLKYFRHHANEIPYQWADGLPVVGDLFSPALEELFGPRRAPNDPLEDRHRDIARCVQIAYEDAFFHLLDALHSLYGMTDIALAGGCAANSVANGKVRRVTRFKRVYVQSAPGDAGGAIGAAFAIWDKLGGERTFVMDHAYWGPQYTADEIASVVGERRSEIESCNCVIEEVLDEGMLCKRIAESISEGKVIGWFQGRMEWGPRALGNRSIVCDPRRADMKSILNAKIKRRESFRPFAPSVLDCAVSDWFEEDDAVPFMMQVFQIRKEKRSQIPAVTHVDGSGRLQTVARHTNPRYYRLIEAFAEITGVPMVLNTSFNENEPVVCRPVEALDCFLRTNMDVLVLGNIVISRTDSLTASTEVGSV
jgi:carbamoyltransferase